MNRRDFLKGVGLASAAVTVRPAVAKSWRDFEVADGKYWLHELAAEPVLAAVSETSVAVSWAVGRLATGGVEIADNPEMRNARYVKSGEMPLAELSSQSLLVRVDGLKAATRYWYRTVTDEVKSIHHPLYAGHSRGERKTSDVHSFMTSGAAGESRFGVMTDTHAQWDAFEFTAKRFREMKFPVGVWTGDALNCTEDRATAVETFLYPDVTTKDYAADTPLLFVPGNHEFGGEYARHIDEIMPCRSLDERGLKYAALRWNFAVRQGDIALIGLDTGDGLHDDDKRLCGIGSFSPYRKLQTQWLEEALNRPEIKSAPFAVVFCHIPLYNSGGNPNGCEKPLESGGASWVRECNEQWGPVLDKYGVQLVICGHEHYHRWDEPTGFRWKQVLGGGPELGYGAGFVPDKDHYPTIIEGVVENGKLVIRTHDVWRNRLVDEHTFERRAYCSTSSGQVRFMSFNIRMGCGHDDPFQLEAGSLGYLPKCAEVIRAANPDCVAIQEIDRGTERAGGVDQTEALAKLCGLHGTFVPKVPRPGGDYGLAILSREKPLKVERVLMPGQAHTRCLMICEFGDYIVANTHFPLSDERCREAAKIVCVNLRDRGKPVILMGDFNSLPSSEAIAVLGKEFDILNDVRAPTWPARKPDRTIDYIMVDKAHAGIVAAGAPHTIAAPEATDHVALVVDVSRK